MKRLEDLIPLEKRLTVEIRYCDIIADKKDEAENMRTRILFDGYTGKYYFHQMKDGEVVKCFEIALSWQPFDGIYIFNYTPDNLHIYEIDSRIPDKVSIQKLEENSIIPGMTCKYDGMTVEFESEKSIKFNGKSVPVTPDSEYAYKILKTKIRAMDGAKGLFRWLENIAATGNLMGYGDDIKIGEFTFMDFDRSTWLKFKIVYG